MSREPEARYSSAEAFREALEACMHQRGSRELAEQARERLAELERWLDDLDETLEDKGRQRAYELLSAARFGFNQALSDWPENPSAQAGFARLHGWFIMSWSMVRRAGHAGQRLARG